MKLIGLLWRKSDKDGESARVRDLATKYLTQVGGYAWVSFNAPVQILTDALEARYNNLYTTDDCDGPTLLGITGKELRTRLRQAFPGTSLARLTMDTIKDYTFPVVIVDVGLWHEVAAIKEVGGTIIEIRMPGSPSSPPRAVNMPDADACIDYTTDEWLVSLLANITGHSTEKALEWLKTTVTKQKI